MESDRHLCKENRTRTNKRNVIIQAEKEYNTTTLNTKFSNVVVHIHNVNFNFKIVETLSTGKTKVRRRVIGRLYKKPNKNGIMVKVHDEFGNALYTPFNSFEDAKTNALNFVDNFLKLTTKQD